MKLVTEYLADAAMFDQLAALEQDPQMRAQLKNQAAAYRASSQRSERSSLVCHCQNHQQSDRRNLVLGV